MTLNIDSRIETRSIAPRRRAFAAAISLALAACVSQVAAYEIDEDATVYDTPTTILGINHIGLSVSDLDAALAFYQGVTGYTLLRRETITSDAAATLYGRSDIRYETAVLEAPNMLFELTEFSHNQAPA